MIKQINENYLKRLGFVDVDGKRLIYFKFIHITVYNYPSVHIHLFSINFKESNQSNQYNRFVNSKSDYDCSIVSFCDFKYIYVLDLSKTESILKIIVSDVLLQKLLLF